MDSSKTQHRTTGASKQSLACCGRSCAPRGKRKLASHNGSTETMRNSECSRNRGVKPCCTTMESPRCDDTTAATSIRSNGRGSNAPTRLDEELTAANHCDAASKRRRLTLPLPEGFDFSMTVCSYGFFCMMPNKASSW